MPFKNSSLRYAVPGIALAGLVGAVAPAAAAAAPTSPPSPAPQPAGSLAAAPLAVASPSPTPTPSPTTSSTDTTVVVRHHHRTLHFHTRYVRTSRLYRGHHHVRRRGHSGRLDRWYRVTYVDGKVVSRELIRIARIRPRTRVMAVGTRPRLHWRALAACESSNRVHIVDPPYYGLYQFDVSTWRSVGGHGLPSQHTRAQQTHRARILFHRRGRAPWPVCGSRL